MKKFIAGLIAAWVYGMCACVQAAELRKDHPDFYVVKEGDTLWDISALFLQTPWLWPEIWHVNDQVDNPHLIYPGDVIALVYMDGQPRLIKNNTGEIRMADGTVKLSPSVRELSRGDAITTIPLDAILPFLVGAQVVAEKDLKNAPYVVAGDEGRIANAEDNRVYVRGITQVEHSKYAFFRRGERYVDPDTKEVLGVEAIHLGGGTKIRNGDPATIRIEKSVSEVMKGDNAWPTNEEQLRPYYFPHAPNENIDATIISVYNGVSQIGQYDVVVLNKGEREGLEVGHVLTVFQRGKEVEDRYARDNENVNKDSGFDRFLKVITNEKDMVTLPDEEAGSLMVFRTFDKVSMALILKAQRPLHVLDKAKTPY
ncbi:LysM peptidoglycan-binding domain-containing protein [Pleionea sp. CnH1-48]|uniref:LysM peptidoglycan-binding domain-containing protein n=1 Tax=Pleionea sp. CnH1-48 TaxID=2954494 RepID=UPI0020978B5C|nr:LysM peptidoglycan-binding domain-containing protein [Pleionea sp. CnH1-48]MCO7226568.1 LysM peptidoglycan-binding domain-containing protein [Pleionea sp. CnH1-48]